MRQAVRKVFDQILMGTGYFAGIVCVVMMLSITYDVIMRYFFIRPTAWAIDISTLGLAFLTPIAAAWVLKREGHVKIDVIMSRLNPKNQALINGITSLLALLACLVFLWKGCEMTWETYRTGELLHRSLEIPKPIVLWPLPFGALLLCVQFVRRVGGYLHSFKTLPEDKEPKTFISSPQ